MLSDWLEALGEAPGPWVVVGAVVLAAPAASRWLRPLAKAAIKGYLGCRDRFLPPDLHARDSLRDLYAEPRERR